MKRPSRQPFAHGGLHLVEEAIHVLRAAPVGALACYYVGSLPFVLGALYYWADMSRNPLAREHIVEASLGLALAYGWMKFWQNVFARQIYALVSATPEAAWTPGRILRVWATQIMIQPWGFFVLPVALITILPFPAVFGFFQNIIVLDDGEPLPAARLIQKARRLTGLGLGEMVIMLFVLLGFALAVLLNWTTVCFAVPQLGQMLLGIDSVFTRSGFHLFNSTFLATMVGLTYLSVDPLVKTAFALRCFYGDSLQTGEDLKAQLKRFILEAKTAVAILLLTLSLAGATGLRAAEAAPPPAAPAPSAPAPAVSPPDLDQSINEVIHQNKYMWRRPRGQNTDTADEGVIGQFVARVRAMLAKMLTTLWGWLRDLLEKLLPAMGGGSASGFSMFSAVTPLQILIFSLLAIVICTLVVFFIRHWKNRRRAHPVVHSAALPAAPDLTDENVGAEQLPEDGWMKLARELLERGEYRLALRAFYLAGLAHLAGHNLISLAKFKSNRDYERELRRRSHAFPELPPAFCEMVGTFERVWYGRHEASLELVGEFTSQVEKLQGRH